MWNRFISVRLPPVVWTAGPQRAVFSTSAAATDGLEAWPCLPQRAHSHTTKCSWRNQAAQPPLVHITFEENTHRHALTFVCKCSCRHELVWICTNRESGPCVSKHTHTHTHKSQYHSSAEPCRDSAIARRFDGWTLRGTRLWLAWSCLEPLPVSAACQLRRVAECQLCHFIRN